MQGYESFDREFLDTADLWHLVPEASVYRFLAENRRRLFPDKMFADLFGPGGRPSIPGPREVEKTSCCLLGAGVERVMLYRFVDAQKAEGFPVRMVCSAVGVSPSAY